MERDKEHITAAMAGEYLGGIRAINTMLDNVALPGSWGALSKKLGLMAERIAVALVHTVAERDSLERRLKP